MRQKTCTICWMLLTGILLMMDHATAVEKQRLVFLGDSLTAGYSLDADLSYPSLIQQRIDREGLPFVVINSGISGDTTAGGLRRLDWLMKQPVSIILIALGANDGLRGFDPAYTRGNLASIISRVKSNSPNTVVLLAGMKMPFNMGAEYTTAFESIYPDLAREYNVRLLPFLLDGVAGNPDLILPDGLHPTARGHEIMADLVWKFLEPDLREKAKTITEQSVTGQ